MDELGGTVPLETSAIFDMAEMLAERIWRRNSKSLENAGCCYPAGCVR
jgi:hypothetical protein